MSSSTAEGLGKPVTVTAPELVAPAELPPVAVEPTGVVVPPELLALLELVVEPPVRAVEPPAVEPPAIEPPAPMPLEPPCELAEDEPPLEPPVPG
jgi:hypothetical protein